MSDKGEIELKKRFCQLIKDDFNINADINGEDLIYKKGVRIDFMLYPKRKLIMEGFDRVWFGVEVKHFDRPGSIGKMSKFLWQCITYTQSTFQVDSVTIKPTFVLGFSNFYQINPDNSEAFFHSISLNILAGLPHVGTFFEIIPKNANLARGWRIRFSTSTYFHLNKGHYHKFNYNIHKVNIGNCS